MGDNLYMYRWVFDRDYGIYIKYSLINLNVKILGIVLLLILIF